MSSLARKLISAGAAPEPTDDDFNLVTALYHFDGTNGGQNNTFLDSSSSSHTITRSGDPTQGTFTPFSTDADRWGVYFDGNDYTSIAANTDFNILGDGTFTVEFWSYVTVYNASYADHAGVFNGVSAGWLIYQNGSNLDVYINGSTVISATRPSANTWHHIALTRDGTTLRLFVDGTSVGTSTASLGSDQSQPLRVGGDTGGGRNGLEGYISNFRLIKGTALYTSNFTAPTESLTAVTNTEALTCQSNRFKDNSTSSHTVTASNGARVTPFSPFAPSAVYSESVNGGSAFFDTAQNYLRSPTDADFDIGGTGDWSYEGWIYVDADHTLNSYTRAFGLGPYYNNAKSFGFMLADADNSGYMTAYWDDASGLGRKLISSETIQKGQWNHLMVCRSGSEIGLFLNGARIANNASYTSAIDTGNTYAFVGHTGFGTEGFVGYAGDIRLINGSHPYDASSSTYTVPTAPLTAVTNTKLLLNGTNASIIDNSMKAVLETVGDAQIGAVVKKFGTASLELDGSGDYLFIPAQGTLGFGSGAFTIECWVYFTASTAYQSIVSSKNYYTAGYNGNWLLRRDSDTLIAFATYDGTSNEEYTQFSASTSLNTWYHLALVREGTGTNETKLYLDGTLKGSMTVSKSLNDGSASGVWVGKDTQNNDYTGYMDDLRITTGKARYTSAFTPSTEAFPDK